MAIVLALVLTVGHAAAAGPEIAPDLQENARHAVDAGLHFLRQSEAEDGSWSKSVGVTAIALRAFLESYRKYGESDGAFITRPVKFIVGHVNSDGSISETMQNRSYNTATAMVALQATGNKAYADTIRKAQQFLAKDQLDEGEGYKTTDPYYGGFGYDKDELPDLSNEYLALEGLRLTSLDPKDPVWGRALKFVSRCQNRSESNDQPWAGNDGGFTYMPKEGGSPHGGNRSYGGMTDAGLISLIFAGVDKKDPRVQAAYDWIRANYTLDTNPGTDGKSGLYYYYEAFAKAMAAYGDSTVVTTDGVKHNWREDYIRKMLSLQKPDGSWVNTDSAKWWENDKNLITARVVVGLDLAMR